MRIRDRFRHYLLWRRHNLQVSRLQREHPLRYLFMEVTRRCNLACVYCGSSCTPRQRDNELSTEEWIGIARQIAGDFDAPSVMVAVTGGEPLLKEGIFDFFRELTSLRFRWGMVTNCTLLHDGNARGLVETGIGSISVSMDAPPEINDQLRGRGASNNVETAVKALQEAAYTGKLEIISTITRPALAHLDEMRRYVSSLRVPLWRVAPVMPIGRAAERPDLVPDSRENRFLLEWIRAARQDDLIPKPEFSEEGFLGYRFEGRVRPYLCQCRAGVTIGGIKCDGRIGACPELTAAFDQGDIRTERFHSVWEDRYQNLRDRSWTKRGPCANCRFYPTCRGGAMHLYDDTEAPFLRCLYLQCKGAEGGAEPGQ